MAETLKTIKERRSCRNFKPDMVSKELLDKVLEAGTWAPTGMGMQSPIIIAVTNKELLDSPGERGIRERGRQGNLEILGYRGRL